MAGYIGLDYLIHIR